MFQFLASTAVVERRCIASTSLSLSPAPIEGEHGGGRPAVHLLSEGQEQGWLPL